MEIRTIPSTSVEEYKIKRVAAYARVSSDKDEAEHSLVAQISYYNDYITHHPGWTFAGVYADSGISGTKDNRPEFQRMMADARAGQFDMLITKSISRLARNAITLVTTVRELNRLGINVYFENEQLDSQSSSGEMMLSMFAMYAEDQSKIASENKRWQIKKYFSEGKPTYFRIYGYKWVDGHLEIIPEEAAVVRRIFDMYLSGMGRQAIARQLNAEGIPSLNTTKWRDSTIINLLQNEKYIGNLLLQKTHKPDFLTKKRFINRGQWQQYLVEHSHEPIISEEIFDAVQLELAQRRASCTFVRSGPTPLFANLLRCNHCGTCFMRKTSPSRTNQKMFIWICGTFFHMGKDYCPSKRIRESILIEKAKEALGLSADTELTRELILTSITSIESAADNRLRFFLKDGTVKVLAWANPSRSRSWTPEMRRQARERTLAQHQARKERK